MSLLTQGCNPPPPKPQLIKLGLDQKVKIMLLDFFVDSNIEKMNGVQEKKSISDLSTQMFLKHLGETEGFEVVYSHLDPNELKEKPEDKPATRPAEPPANLETPLTPETFELPTESLNLTPTEDSTTQPETPVNTSPEPDQNANPPENATHPDDPAPETFLPTSSIHFENAPITPMQTSNDSPTQDTAPADNTPTLPSDQRNQQNPDAATTQFMPSIDLAIHEIPMDRLAEIALSNGCAAICKGEIRLTTQSYSFSRMNFISLEATLRVINPETTIEDFSKMYKTTFGVDSELKDQKEAQLEQLSLDFLKPYITEATLELTNSYARYIQNKPNQSTSDAAASALNESTAGENIATP